MQRLCGKRKNCREGAIHNDNNDEPSAINDHRSNASSKKQHLLADVEKNEAQQECKATEKKAKVQQQQQDPMRVYKWWMFCVFLNLTICHY